jgi:flagellar basal-body rod modification protein FlgD
MTFFSPSASSTNSTSSTSGAAQSSSQSSTQASEAGLSANYELFLSMLTTQIQNQDPLDPLDSAEYTNQLVQYSNVEQSIQTNKNLEEMISLLVEQSVVGLRELHRHRSDSRWRDGNVR